MASYATKMAILGNMHIDSKVMEVIVIKHHMPISHSPCRHRSKGLLPSGFFKPSRTVSVNFWEKIALDLKFTLSEGMGDRYLESRVRSASSFATRDIA